MKWNAINKSARDGHLIYCYGDCERKYQETLAAMRENHTGDVMKNIWLDDYNKQSKNVPNETSNNRQKR